MLINYLLVMWAFQLLIYWIQKNVNFIMYLNKFSMPHHTMCWNQLKSFHVSMNKEAINTFVINSRCTYYNYCALIRITETLKRGEAFTSDFFFVAVFWIIFIIIFEACSYEFCIYFKFRDSFWVVYLIWLIFFGRYALNIRKNIVFKTLKNFNRLFKFEK